MSDEQLTPIEQSRAATGYRHYKVEPNTYTQMAAGVDATRAYPRAFTKRGLPPADDLPKDEDGNVLIAIDCWRFTAADDDMIAPAEDAGLVIELTKEDFDALLGGLEGRVEIDPKTIQSTDEL